MKPILRGSHAIFMLVTASQVKELHHFRIVRFRTPTGFLSHDHGTITARSSPGII